MPLRKIAKILGISPTYLSLLLNERRPRRGNLKERYEELVNTTEAITPLPKASKDDFVSGKKDGGAGGTRTLDFLNAIEALSQLSYSPAEVQYTRGIRPVQHQPDVGAGMPCVIPPGPQLQKPLCPAPPETGGSGTRRRRQAESPTQPPRSSAPQRPQRCTAGIDLACD